MGLPEKYLSLENQREYMLIYNLREHANVFNRIAYKCNIHSIDNRNISCVSDCDPYNLSSVTPAYIGQAVEVVRHERKGILAQMQQYNYKIQHTTGKYSVSDVHTAHADLKYGESAPALHAIAFTHDTEAQQRVESLGAMLQQQNTLLKSTETTNRTVELLNSNEELSTNIRTQIVVNNTDATDTQIRRIAARVNNTYINVVHDCDRLCVQSALSDNDVFLSGGTVTRQGLLCARRLAELHSTSTATTAKPAIHTIDPEELSFLKRQGKRAGFTNQGTIHSLEEATPPTVLAILITAMIVISGVLLYSIFHSSNWTLQSLSDHVRHALHIQQTGTHRLRRYDRYGRAISIHDINIHNNNEVQELVYDAQSKSRSREDRPIELEAINVMPTESTNSLNNGQADSLDDEQVDNNSDVYSVHAFD